MTVNEWTRLLILSVAAEELIKPLTMIDAVISLDARFTGNTSRFAQ